MGDAPNACGLRHSEPARGRRRVLTYPQVEEPALSCGLVVIFLQMEAGHKVRKYALVLRFRQSDKGDLRP